MSTTEAEKQAAKNFAQAHSRAWTHPKTGEVRYYLRTDLASHLGHYPGGFGYSRIAGRESRVGDAKQAVADLDGAWIDADGSIHASRYGSSNVHWIEEGIAHWAKKATTPAPAPQAAENEDEEDAPVEEAPTRTVTRETYEGIPAAKAGIQVLELDAEDLLCVVVSSKIERRKAQAWEEFDTSIETLVVRDLTEEEMAGYLSVEKNGMAEKKRRTNAREALLRLSHSVEADALPADVTLMEARTVEAIGEQGIIGSTRTTAYVDEASATVYLLTRGTDDRQAVAEGEEAVRLARSFPRR